MRNTFSSRGVTEALSNFASLLDDFMESYWAGCIRAPGRLLEAMKYSFSAGGKRFRPALCLAWSAQAGLDMMDVLPFAAAIEMIHTYSLIHDDLPAMDNDDWRRGKPSSHVAFDEATAILAGDALLTDAFGLCLKTRAPAAAILCAISELAKAAGSSGMAGGQMLDMIFTGQGGGNLSELKTMDKMKTGEMIRFPCICGGILASSGKSYMNRANDYGTALGEAFQIADDILDVTGSTGTMGKPAGSDEREGKITWPALVGMEESKKSLRLNIEKACAALDDFAGPQTDFLRNLAIYTGERSI